MFVTIDLIKREDGEERQKERGIFDLSQSKRIRGDVVKVVCHSRESPLLN